MSKIQSAFLNTKACIAFITCGDPDLETTEKNVMAAIAGGADLIELGIPFSDPVGENPVAERSAQRALNNGTTTDDVFSMIKNLRQKTAVPMVFRTYANVVYSYGAERFIAECAQLGVDGLVLPDVPCEEQEEFLPLCNYYGVDLISFITPASGSRFAMITKKATGFLYIACNMEAAENNEKAAQVQKIIENVRQNSTMPCVVEVDGEDCKQLPQLAKLTDGVITAQIIAEISEKYSYQAPDYIYEHIRRIKLALA